jgi:hypothetical protein
LILAAILQHQAQTQVNYLQSPVEIEPFPKVEAFALYPEAEARAKPDYIVIAKRSGDNLNN